MDVIFNGLWEWIFMYATVGNVSWQVLGWVVQVLIPYKNKSMNG